MQDSYLLELYSYLTPEANRVFKALSKLDTATMERLMIEGAMTTQQVRRGVWGLGCTGLVSYTPGRPLRMAPNGKRLVRLLAQRAKEAR